MSQVKLTADTGGGTTSIKGPAQTTGNADVVLKLPVADGSSGQVLKTDGSGQLSFTSNAGTTINNNADNRIITGSGTASTLEAESSLTWDGNDLSLSGTAPAINFTDTDADDYKIHNVQGLLKITDTTASADRFVINDNGTGYFVNNFQIGAATTSPGATLHLKTSFPSLKIDSGGHASDSYVRMIAGSSENSRVEFGDSDDDDIGMIDYDHANNSMAFKTNTSERMRIDSSGRVMIGTTTEGYSGAEQLTVAASLDGGITIRTGTGNGGILAFSDGSSGISEYRGYVQYQHQNDALAFGSNATERMRLLSNGALAIGATSSSGQFLHVRAPSSSSGQSVFIDSDNSSVSNAFGVKIECSGEQAFSLNNGSIVVQNVDSVGGNNRNAQIGRFLNGSGSAVGVILMNDSTTSYSTSSDYRLKENQTLISDGITRLKQLKPYRFNWKTDTSKTVDGFFAHEVSSVVPESIFGEKDAVDSGGNPSYQSMDHSKLVPLLTAALQEEVAKREALEVRVAALEAA